MALDIGEGPKKCITITLSLAALVLYLLSWLLQLGGLSQVTAECEGADACKIYTNLPWFTMVFQVLYTVIIASINLIIFNYF